MVSSIELLKYSGLSGIADALKIERVGVMHQAGSDSLLTLQCYFAVVKKHMSGICDDKRYKGELYGLGKNFTRNFAKQYLFSGGASMGGYIDHSNVLQYTSNVHFPIRAQGY